MLDPISRYLKRLLEGPKPSGDRGHRAPAAEPGFAPAETGLPETRRIRRELPASDLDRDAVRVVERLSAEGHEAYLVGGCVRDLLFGVRPKDFDIVTSAHPPEIKRLFRNCRIIGRRFRLAHVHFRDKILEVATFRAESVARDADGELLIRDDNVFGSAEQDAARRDFTVNALFYDVEAGEIIDYVGGVEDAEKRLIRMIGDPRVRLREDPIRMLRAVRLAARVGCTIEEQTWRAIQDFRAEVLDAAAPRIGEELLRMFRGGAMAPAFDMMLSSGLIDTVLPELSGHLRGESNREAVEELKALQSVLRVADRWAREERKLTPAVHLALLVSPILLDAIVGRQVRDPGVRISEMLRPIAQRLAISKRDAERVRLILLAQEKLAPRSKRRGGAALVKRGYFPEALDLFELLTESTGDLRENARRWRRRLEEEYPDGVPVQTRKRPVRRRRRRREHGEKGARTA